MKTFKIKAASYDKNDYAAAIPATVTAYSTMDIVCVQGNHATARKPYGYNHGNSMGRFPISL